MKLSEQQKTPHASLVQIRNVIEVVTECSRKDAAEIAGNLTVDQCNRIVSADGDAAKIKEAIKPKATETKPVEEPKATETKPKSKRK